MADEAMIYAETEFTVGVNTTLESGSPKNRYMVVFEDDGDTGYLYGLDRGRDGNPILDALHIYNVVNVTDKHLPSEAQIVWSGDGNKALLLKTATLMRPSTLLLKEAIVEPTFHLQTKNGQSTVMSGAMMFLHCSESAFNKASQSDQKTPLRSGFSAPAGGVRR